MTTLTDIPVDQLREQAAQARPGHALVTFISAVFVCIGWITGRTLFGIVFCAKAVRWGYRLGLYRDPLTGRRPGEPAPAEAPPRPSKL